MNFPHGIFYSKICGDKAWPCGQIVVLLKCLYITSIWEACEHTTENFLWHSVRTRGPEDTHNLTFCNTYSGYFSFIWEYRFNLYVYLQGSTKKFIRLNITCRKMFHTHIIYKYTFLERCRSIYWMIILTGELS